MAKLNLGKIVGRSAYEEAVRQGYDDSEVEWLKTLTAYGIAKKNVIIILNKTGLIYGYILFNK